MEKYEVKGGGKAGWWHASWPFSSLSVTGDRLDFQVGMVGTYSFTRDDIQSLDTFRYVPLLLQGITIRHSVSEYPDRLVFYSLWNPDRVLREIEETGFLSGSTSEPGRPDVRREIHEKQKQGGFPVRWSFVFFFLVVWNGLCLIDFWPFLSGTGKGVPLGEGNLAAVGFALVVTLLTLFSKTFRKQFVLKEGRSLEEIKPFLYFLLVLFTFLFIGCLSFLGLKYGLAS